MAKFRIEVDGPSQGVFVMDGASRLDFSNVQMILDAPSGQNFIVISQDFPNGTIQTALDITRATILLETKEG